MSLTNHPNVLGGSEGGAGRSPDGVFYGLNGQTITGDANGAWAVTANGTNQNITLTPSGTGNVNAGVTTGYFQLNGRKLASTDANNQYLFGGTTALVFRNNGDSAELTRLLNGGTWLFGTTTDSANGRIQLATHTTSAGGIGFGTSAALFTPGPNQYSFGMSTTANGQSLNLKYLTELTTIAAAATTDTTIQMPANAIVLSVSVRVTVVIPTAATFTVGDSGSAARFSTAAVSTAANSTDTGTKAGAYYNASALSVRITPNASPADNTGRVRVTIAYLDVTVPTA